MLNNRTFQAIVSAFWLAFLCILGANFIGNKTMTGSWVGEEEKIEKFGFPIEAVEEVAAGGDAAAGGPRPDIKPMIVAAKIDDGAAVFRKCASCHTAEAGGKNGTGPNLHNIVGDDIGDRNGYKTSESLKAIGGKWTYDKLDDYVENPKHLAPKGTMSFAGLKKPADRAAVIKYLMSNTENPPAIEASAAPAAPAAEAAPAAAPAAPKKP
jgi:cytochrome c